MSTNLLSLENEDVGADTYSRFNFQHWIAAIYGIKMLNGIYGRESKNTSNKIDSIYCEHFEDFIIKLNDGQLIACQVKSQKKSDSIDYKNDALIRSILNFYQLEKKASGEISEFHIVFNRSITKSLEQTLSKLRDIKKLDRRNRLVSKLSREISFDKTEEIFLLKVFRKLNVVSIHDNLASGFEERLVPYLNSTSKILAGYSYAKLLAVSKELLDLVDKASSNRPETGKFEFILNTGFNERNSYKIIRKVDFQRVLENHCPTIRFDHFIPQNNNEGVVIPRMFQDIESKFSYSFEDLYDFIRNDTTQSKGILLSGIQYSGKTTQLLEFAHFLTTKKIWVYYKELSYDFSSSQGDLLKSTLGHIPSDRLVFIFDGLDETQSNFTRTEKWIKSVREAWSNSYFIVSCRENRLSSLDELQKDSSKFKLANLDLESPSFEKLFAQHSTKSFSDFKLEFNSSIHQHRARESGHVLTVLIKYFDEFGNLSASEIEIRRRIYDAQIKDKIGRLPDLVREEPDIDQLIHTDLSKIAFFQLANNLNSLLKDEIKRLSPKLCDSIAEVPFIYQKNENHTIKYAIEPYHAKEWFAVSLLNKLGRRDQLKILRIDEDLDIVKPEFNYILELHKAIQLNDNNGNDVIELANFELDEIHGELSEADLPVKLDRLKLILDDLELNDLWLTSRGKNIDYFKKLCNSVQVADFVWNRLITSTNLKEKMEKNLAYLYSEIDKEFKVETEKRKQDVFKKLKAAKDSESDIVYSYLRLYESFDDLALEEFKAVFEIFKNSDSDNISAWINSRIHENGWPDRFADYLIASYSNLDERLTNRPFNLSVGMSLRNCLTSFQDSENIILVASKLANERFGAFTDYKIEFKLKILSRLLEVQQDRTIEIAIDMLLSEDYYHNISKEMSVLIANNNHFTLNEFIEKVWGLGRIDFKEKVRALASFEDESVIRFLITQCDSQKDIDLVAWSLNNARNKFFKRYMAFVEEDSRFKIFIPTDEYYIERDKNQFRENIELLLNREKFERGVIEAFQNLELDGLKWDEMHRKIYDNSEDSLARTIREFFVDETPRKELLTGNTLIKILNTSLDNFTLKSLASELANNKKFISEIVDYEDERKIRALVQAKWNLSDWNNYFEVNNNCWTIYKQFAWSDMSLIRNAMVMDYEVKEGKFYFEETDYSFHQSILDSVQKEELIEAALLNIEEYILHPDSLSKHIHLICDNNSGHEHFDAIKRVYNKIIDEKARLSSHAINRFGDLIGDLDFLVMLLSKAEENTKWEIIYYLEKKKELTRVKDFLWEVVNDYPKIKGQNDSLIRFERRKHAIETLIKLNDFDALKIYAEEIDSFDPSPNYSCIQSFDNVKGLPLLEVLLVNYFKSSDSERAFNRFREYVTSALSTIGRLSKENFKEVLGFYDQFISKYQSEYDGVNFLILDKENLVKAYYLEHPSSVSTDELLAILETVES